VQLILEKIMDSLSFFRMTVDFFRTFSAPKSNFRTFQVLQNENSNFRTFQDFSGPVGTLFFLLLLVCASN